MDSSVSHLCWLSLKKDSVNTTNCQDTQITSLFWKFYIYIGLDKDSNCDLIKKNQTKQN